MVRYKKKNQIIIMELNNERTLLACDDDIEIPFEF